MEDFQKFWLKLRTSLTLSLYRNREEALLVFFFSFHYQWCLFLLKLEKLGNKFEERLHILIFVLKRMTFFVCFNCTYHLYIPTAVHIFGI